MKELRVASSSGMRMALNTSKPAAVWLTLRPWSFSYINIVKMTTKKNHSEYHTK